jgi:hypothetical protein
MQIVKWRSSAQCGAALGRSSYELPVGPRYFSVPSEFFSQGLVDFQNGDALHSIMPTRYLSREELGKLSAWANREFYSKPERIERIRNSYTSPYVRMKFETYQAAAHLIDQ